MLNCNAASAGSRRSRCHRRKCQPHKPLRLQNTAIAGALHRRGRHPRMRPSPTRSAHHRKRRQKLWLARVIWVTEERGFAIEQHPGQRPLRASWEAPLGSRTNGYAHFPPSTRQRPVVICSGSRGDRPHRIPAATGSSWPRRRRRVIRGSSATDSNLRRVSARPWACRQRPRHARPRQHRRRLRSTSPSLCGSTPCEAQRQQRRAKCGFDSEERKKSEE